MNVVSARKGLSSGDEGKKEKIKDLNEKLDDVQMSLGGGIVEGGVGADGLTMIWIGASFKKETNEIKVATRGSDLERSLSLSVLHFQKRVECFERGGRRVAARRQRLDVLKGLFLFVLHCVALLL